MNKTFGLLTAILLLFCFQGCATKTVTQLKIGMTKAEVTQIMGPPYTVTKEGNHERLTYILVEDGGQTSSTPLVRRRTYVIQVVDDHIVSFGYPDQLTLH
jgi:outer membrane protein assembly factor BamE (lipoprotein component of BamABCDE complex)